MWGGRRVRVSRDNPFVAHRYFWAKLTALHLAHHNGRHKGDTVGLLNKLIASRSYRRIAWRSAMATSLLPQPAKPNLYRPRNKPSSVRASQRIHCEENTVSWVGESTSIFPNSVHILVILLRTVISLATSSSSSVFAVRPAFFT